VVDDGSTDETAEAARAFLEGSELREGAVVAASPMRRGASAARNLGLAEAGDAALVAFLDSDDLWPPDFLERAAGALSGDPGAVAASADLQILEPHGAPRLRELDGIAEETLPELFRDAGIGSASLCRASAVRACGGYDESLKTGHDAQLFLRLALRGRWLHVAGASAIKREGFAAPGESGQIRADHAEREGIWAAIYERFVREHGSSAAVRRARGSELAARRWRQAGAALAREGRVREARACYRAALARRPVWPHVWWRYLRSLF